MRKIIDLSVAVSLKGNLQVKPQIIYRRHEETPQFFSPAIGIKPEEFPEGKYCAVEVLTLGTHNTTHLDAPYHFYPTSEGKPAKTIDRIPGGLGGHEQDWVRACKGGKPASSNFDFSGPLSEMVLMGNLAVRYPNRRLLWDGAKMQVTNDADANSYVRRQYRQGWSL